MNDSTFAVAVLLASVAISITVGVGVMYLYFHGTHECQVEVQHTDHVAVYMTECRL